MKVVFAHDHRFIRYGSRIYSESQFQAALWERYLIHFDELIVACRLGRFPMGKTPEELVRSDHQSVRFEFLPNISSAMGQLQQHLNASKQLRQIIVSADAVIARLPSEIGLLAISIACREKRPYAVEIVGCAWDALWNYGTWQSKIYAPLLTWRIRRAVRKAAFSLYVTRNFLQQRYPCLNGYTTFCSNVEIQPPSKDVLEKRLMSITNRRTPIVLGLIGTLRTRYKGIQTVLQALAQIRNDIPHVTFHILGEGDSSPWHEEAKRLGVDDITFFDGTLPAGESVLRWLDNVDIYLQPSFQEGLPRALIEAMSRGCPALGTICAGIPELLDPKCLITPGDASHLSNLILHAIVDTNWQIVQAGRNWETAGDYARDELNARRQKFWSTFASYTAEQIIKT